MVCRRCHERGPGATVNQLVLGREPLTLEAIGQRIGLTRERIRQIESAALRKLRALFEARGMSPRR